MAPLRVMLSCGEPSGDLYAGALASEILKLEPAAIVTGFGGERMQAAGATLVREFRGLSVTGLTEALRVIPRSWQTYRALVRAAEAERPDVFVPIDFVDFNAFLTRALHKRGVPVVYYISPQLWAWRPGRIKTVKRVADRVLVIFPFELPFSEQAGVPVTFVASGTVTVQAALHTCPMVVVYRLAAMTYRLGKPLLQVDTYAMANLVAGHRVVPELIQDEFTPEATARHALAVLTDPSYAA